MRTLIVVKFSYSTDPWNGSFTLNWKQIKDSLQHLEPRLVSGLTQRLCHTGCCYFRTFWDVLKRNLIASGVVPLPNEIVKSHRLEADFWVERIETDGLSHSRERRERHSGIVGLHRLMRIYRLRRADRDERTPVRCRKNVATQFTRL